jgi:glutamine amidotransferase
VIAVLDYGIGNLRSAEKALQRVGAEARLISDPAEAASAAGFVLPGVGAFGACAAALRSSGLDAVAREGIARGVPFLGICVGFQLMFAASQEDPEAEGLGVWEGVVRALPSSEKRPQMQWNVLRLVAGRDSALLGTDQADRTERWFYFVHSYAPEPEGAARHAVVGTCDYGAELVALMEDGNTFGAQFHPEKSGREGLELLGRFARLCE